MADTATAEVEHVDMNIGGDPRAETDWGKMTEDQQSASVDKAFADVRARRVPESAVELKDEADEIEITTKTPADGDETSAADDAAETNTQTVKGEGEGEDDESADWLDDNTREFASMMGLTDDDLAEFGSREELDRALRLIDRKAFEAGKDQQKVPAKSIEKPPAQQLEKHADKEATPSDHLAELTSFKLDEELGADDAPKIVKAFAAVTAELKELRAWRDATQQQSQQQAVADIRRQAAESIHSLGNTELFGKPGERPTKEQAANIEKAIDAHFVHARGLLATGRQAAPTPAFLKAAVHLAFGDQLSKLQEKRLTDKLRKQSSRRIGGPPAKTLVSKVPPKDETPRQRAERLCAEGLSQRYKELAEQS